MSSITSLDERRNRKGKQSADLRSARKTKVVYKQSIDYKLLVPVVALVALGLVMVYSSSYYAAYFREASMQAENPAYFFIRQLLFALVGFGVMAGLAFFDYHRFYYFRKKAIPQNLPIYKRFYFWILLAALLLAVMVFIPGLGSATNSSSRWIRLFGITIMPAEPMKFAIIIALGCDIGYNTRKATRLNRALIPHLLVYLLILGITVLQRNFSAVLCYTLLILVMLFVAGLDWKHMLFIVGVLFIGLILIVFMEGYREARISDWWNMFLESIGMPHAEVDRDQRWQVQQSLYAIGTGGLFGKGLGNSIQKYLWLSLGETDFIFAIIAEELGLVGSICVLLLYGYIIYRGIRIAKNACDNTGKLIATGVTAILAIQVVLNVGVATALIPNTGVVLPFISYGGSSLLIFMGMIGVLLNVSRQCTPIEPVKEIKKAVEKRERRQEEQTEEPKKDNVIRRKEWKI